jgi:molybdate transport system ATP-binding protein
VSGLAATGRSTLGSLELQVELEVGPTETVAVIGPNGAGKTTLLHVLSGLRRLESGRLTLDAAVLDDPGAGRWVAPEHRSIGVVFQDLLLFPTADVADNVAFGLRAAGVRRRDARARALEWLDRFGLAGRGQDAIGTLSGGEAQRVALARALAPTPKVLLLDEPLSALDADVRAAVRRDLKAHLRLHQGPTVLVTHDPLDAAVLADRVVVLEDGAVTASGHLAELVAHPRTPWAAELAGTNLLHGVAHGPQVDLGHGGALVAAEPPGDGPVLVAVRPSAVALHADRPEGSPRNVWAATVAEIEGFGERRRVRLDGPVPLVAEVTVDGLAALRLVPGSSVWASVKATELRVYPS